GPPWPPAMIYDAVPERHNSRSHREMRRCVWPRQAESCASLGCPRLSTGPPAGSLACEHADGNSGETLRATGEQDPRGLRGRPPVFPLFRVPALPGGSAHGAVRAPEQCIVPLVGGFRRAALPARLRVFTPADCPVQSVGRRKAPHATLVRR